jgi:CDP-glycerol glycerophosphotransferase (TagB/SpsB family)
MQRILWLIETILFYILSYIVPKDENLVIFGCRKWTAIIGSPRVYYLYLQKYASSDTRILFYDKDNVNDDNRIITYGNTLYKYILMLRAKYIIIDNCSFDVGLSWVFIWNFSIIQMWHGEPIKAINFLSPLYISRRSSTSLFFEKREYKMYKYILSNTKTADLIGKAFLNNDAVLGIWLPRNDALVHSDILNQVKNIKVEAYLDLLHTKYNEIILWSPTFRDYLDASLFSYEELDILNQKLKSINTILLIKKHPRDKKILKIEKEYSNIGDVTIELPYDATDFLPYIDTLMTDYSSIYIDFLISKKPIIFYQPDLHEYIANERELLYSPEEVVIQSMTAHNFNRLIEILQDYKNICSLVSYADEYEWLSSIFYPRKVYQESCKDLTELLFPVKSQLN